MAFEWYDLCSAPLLAGTCVFIALNIIFYWISKPLNRVKKLHEIGYEAQGPFSKIDVCNLERRLRKTGPIPPPFGNGWYSLAESRDLKAGTVKQVAAIGKQFAVFRGQDNEVHVLDAYCPHLGANMAIGGKVINGNCLQCPFHGWTFRGTDGKCVDIPYSTGKIPDIAKTRSYTCVERNAHVYIWYHAEGAEPTWEVPVIPDFQKMIYRGRTEHYINCHIEDLPENGADVSHLNVVHRTSLLRGSDLKKLAFNGPSTGHFWTPGWHQEAVPNSHVGILTLNHDIRIAGMKLPLSEIKVSAKQIGPAFVYLFFDMGLLGNAVLIHHLLPIEPTLVRVAQQLYTTSRTPGFLANIVLLGDALQMERDIVIWNHKTYVSKPLLVKEDALVNHHRRHYAQFYSENSPRLSSDGANGFVDVNDW